MSKVLVGDRKAVELCLSWRPASNGDVPEGAVNAGDDCFVARIRHNDEWVPAKLPKGHNSAYAPYGGEEKSSEEYEVLVATDIGSYGEGFHWEQCESGELPKRALVAGKDADSPLFIAKGTVNGELCVGKLHPDHKCAYLPWGGAEHKVESCEVLVMN